MPLSKRINNLHLTNPGQVNGSAAYGNPNLNSRPGTSAGPSTQSGMNGQDILMEGQRTHNDPHSQLVLNGHSHHNHNHHHQQHQQHTHHHHPVAHAQDTPSTGHADPAGYDPELGQSDNPHYFHRNKLLYELHFIRSRRCHPDNDWVIPRIIKLSVPNWIKERCQDVLFCGTCIVSIQNNRNKRGSYELRLIIFKHKDLMDCYSNNL